MLQLSHLLPMPRLDFVQAVQEPFPEDGTIQDLTMELTIHCQFPADKQSALWEALGAESSIDQIKALSLHQVRTLVHSALGGSKPVEGVINNIQMLLGSFLQPFNFRDFEASTQTTKKGGCMMNRGGVLQPRRPIPTQYFPPEEFDVHRIGSTSRNEAALRRLIPKEVCASMPVAQAHHMLLTTRSHMCHRCRQW